MITWLRKHRIPCIIFCIAILARWLFFYVTYENHQKNLLSSMILSDGYYELTENLLAGHGFSQTLAAPFPPDAERMPLYPLAMAGLVYVFRSYWAVLVLQIIVASIIPILGWELSKYITDNERISFFVGLALALEPTSVMLSGVILTETLFTFLFLIALISFFKYLREFNYQNILKSALFLGLATLTKPTVQFLPFLLVVFIIWRLKDKILLKKLMSQLFIFISLFALILTPWAYRNYWTFGRVFLTIQSTKNLYMYLVPSAIALENGKGIEEAKRQFFTQEGQKGMNLESLYSPQRESEFKKHALIELKKHPVGLLESFVVTTITFFTHDGYLSVIQQLGYLSNFHFKTIKDVLTSSALLVMLGRVGWIIITTLFVVGLVYFLKDKEKRATTWLMSILIVYFTATSMIIGLGINARFRSPINALIFICAFYGVNTICLFVKNRRSKVMTPTLPPSLSLPDL